MPFNFTKIHAYQSEFYFFGWLCERLRATGWQFSVFPSLQRLDESRERSQDVTKKDCSLGLAGGKLQHDLVPLPCKYLHVVYDQIKKNTER